LHGWSEALGVNLLDVPLKTLEKIMGARRPRDVLAILEDLADALLISPAPEWLEIEEREWRDDDLKRRGVVLDWVKRPDIHVKPEFQAEERFISHNEFWRTRQVTTVTVQLDPETKAAIDFLARREREREEWERVDDAARLGRLLNQQVERKAS
jgi:hypothetical protein